MSARRKREEQEGHDTADLDAIVATAGDLYLRIFGTIPPHKVSETAGQWLAKASEVDDDTFARAMVLAMDLETFTPSSIGGSTAFDRLEKHAVVSAVETAAFALIRNARVTVFEIAALDEGGQSFAATDLVGGATLTIFDAGVGPEAIGARAFARLVALQDGTFCTLGPITPLDDDGLKVAHEFLAKGKRSAQDHRCAAAVYKHVIRHGNPKVIGLNHHPEMEAEYAAEAETGYGPDPIDLAAQVWENDPPSEDLLAELRSLATVDAVVESLFKAFALSETEDLRVRGEAYRAIADLHIRTLQKRFEAGTGSLSHPLDRIAEAIDEEVRLNDYPRGAQALFQALRDKLLAESRPKAADDGLTKVIERIRALRAKTPDQGCTESEALAAAAKVAELLDRYGLTLSGIEIEQQSCEGIGIDSTRKRAGPLDECLHSIATFCDCMAWQEKTGAGYLRTIFFGLPADVEAAHFLHGRVAGAIDTEVAAFKAGKTYAETAPGDRRRATHSFQLGLAEGIQHKLKTLKKERARTVQGSGGQDLVPLKSAAVEDGLSKLGLRFKAKTMASRMVEPLSYRAGQAAGRQFRPMSDIKAGS